MCIRDSGRVLQLILDVTAVPDTSEDQLPFIQRVLHSSGQFRVLCPRGSHGDVDDLRLRISSETDGPGHALRPLLQVARSYQQPRYTFPFLRHSDRKDLGPGSQTIGPGALATRSRARDQGSHHGAVFSPVGVFVAFLTGVVDAVQYLAPQVGRTFVNAGVNHCDGDAFTGACLPHLIGAHEVEMPLLLPSGLGLRGSRHSTRQHQPHESRQRWAEPGALPADTHLVSTSYGFGG